MSIKLMSIKPLNIGWNPDDPAVNPYQDYFDGGSDVIEGVMTTPDGTYHVGLTGNVTPMTAGDLGVDIVPAQTMVIDINELMSLMITMMIVVMMMKMMTGIMKEV